jgi:hypothetical protein
MSSPSPTDTEPPVLTDDDLAVLAEDLLDAILRDADTDTIGVSNWWPRATSALTAGASRGDCVRTVATCMAAKLQITTAFRVDVAAEVDRIAKTLRDQAVFARWRGIAERDAVFIAGMVRLRRQDRTEQRKAAARKPAAAKPTAPQANTLMLPERATF